MLWLALHLPLLSLEAFCTSLTAAARAGPVVLLQQHAISHVNTAAAECGIRPGMKRATALALAPDLLIAQASPARDAAALLAVAHVALVYTPAVSLHDSQQDNQQDSQQGSNTVLMEVQASLRLFGGLAVLHQRLLQSLAPLQHHVKIAAAPTAQGAALLARWQPARQDDAVDLLHGAHATHLPTLHTLLDAVPVWLLGPGREHWDALQGMGLHSLGDLRQLPRTGLARRFGEGLLADLDRARGQLADPRTAIELPSEFNSQLELFAAAENTDQVLHAAAVLLARLVAWAQARHARVAAFTLRMRHERRRQTDMPATELHIEMAEPALDATHLQLLLRERLARIELAAPTLELHLHCHHLVAGHAPNGELFPTRASHAEGLTRLLERLRARLGDAQVQRLVPVADHRPEHASHHAPTQGRAVSLVRTALQRPGASASLPLQRPAWLLPEPMPLAERATHPLLEGRPLQLVSGPERIEAGWWDAGTPAVRDYFIAQAEDGSLVWLYRARLPNIDNAAGEANWFLQGRFA
jgi:protein ImuB